MLHYFDVALTIIFGLEVVAKVTAFGPRIYFTAITNQACCCPPCARHRSHLILLPLVGTLSPWHACLPCALALLNLRGNLSTLAARPASTTNLKDL